MDCKQGENQDKKPEDRPIVSLVFCPRNILNCSLAGVLIALFTIVTFEVGIIIYTRVING